MRSLLLLLPVLAGFGGSALAATEIGAQVKAIVPGRNALLQVYADPPGQVSCTPNSFAFSLPPVELNDKGQVKYLYLVALNGSVIKNYILAADETRFSMPGLKPKSRVSAYIFRAQLNADGLYEYWRHARPQFYYNSIGARIVCRTT